MSSNTVISVEHVSKVHKVYDKPSDRFMEWISRKTRHKVVTSLNDVSFVVEKGETVGIIGRNGAGKSTILQIIAGTQTPTNGNVSVSGRVVALLELGAGFNMEFTGRENVFLYGAILGLTQEEIKQRYDSILEFAEIGEFINYPVKTYSSGMFVRLAFSVVISVDPDILIVDEALSVGDMQFQHKCIAKLKELQAKGCTILFVSHDIDSVKSLCTSAILLHKGTIHSSGTPEEISNNYLELVHKEQLEKRRVVSLEGIEKHIMEDSGEDWTPDTFTYSERHGIGQARIVRLVLKDEYDRQLEAVEFGKSLHVSAFIEYDEAVTTDINVGIMFRDDKGLDILGDDSWNHRVLLPRGQQGSRFIIHFDFPNMWLKPGSYSIAIALGAMSENHTTWNDYFYDWIDRAKIVQVQHETKRVWSKVLLPAHVHID